MQSVSGIPNRHEWPIRRENGKLCIWFGMVRGFFQSDRARHFRDVGLVRQPLQLAVTRPCKAKIQYLLTLQVNRYCILSSQSSTPIIVAGWNILFDNQMGFFSFLGDVWEQRHEQQNRHRFV